MKKYVVEGRWEGTSEKAWEVYDEFETLCSGMKSLKFYRTCCGLDMEYRLVEQEGDTKKVIA